MEEKEEGTNQKAASAVSRIVLNPVESRFTNMELFCSLSILI